MVFYKIKFNLLKCLNKFKFNFFKYIIKDFIMGIGDWGLGIGDWGLGPFPNPQSPSPNPHPQVFNDIFKKIKFKFI